MPSPNGGITVDYMSSVSVGAPNDDWVAGYHIAVIGFSEPYQTTTWHYDGVFWSLVDAPDVTSENNDLRGVVALPGGRAMSVGFWDTGTQLRTLSERWTGARWNVTAGPNRSDLIDELYAVDAGPAALWSVGQTLEAGAFRTLIQRYGC